VGQSGHSENQVVDSNNLHRKHFETGNFLNWNVIPWYYR
jgi:hypothetical protein